MKDSYRSAQKFQSSFGTFKSLNTSSGQNVTSSPFEVDRYILSLEPLLTSLARDVVEKLGLENHLLQDLKQAALLRLCEQAHRYQWDGLTKPTTWIHKVARNAMLNEARRHVRQHLALDERRDAASHFDLDFALDFNVALQTVPDAALLLLSEFGVTNSALGTDLRMRRSRARKKLRDQCGLEDC